MSVSFLFGFESNGLWQLREGLSCILSPGIGMTGLEQNYQQTLQELKRLNQS